MSPPVNGSGPSQELGSVRQLCHDLIDPATTIRVLAEIATRESPPGVAATERLRQIVDEAERIVETCTYFLDQPRPPQPVRLDVLAADLLRSRRMTFAGTIDAVTEPVTLSIHHVVLFRVLSNLLDNACRAAGPEGKVRLRVERSGTAARVEVADSGPGMGSGHPGKASLGLEIAEELVRESRGSMELGRSDLGGAAVRVRFPLQHPAAAPSGPAGGHRP